MSESFATRVMRWGFNSFPAYRRTGARIIYIARDWREVRIRLPLNWRTRNYVGTLFGGSIYGAVDPIYMMMLIKILGPEYVVWDKAASISFRKPGTGTLFATFRLTEQEVDLIKAASLRHPSMERVYTIELVDAEGTVHAVIEKTLYIRKKSIDGTKG